jgi:hypothetical protein
LYALQNAMSSNIKYSYRMRPGQVKADSGSQSSGSTPVFIHNLARRFQSAAQTDVWEEPYPSNARTIFAGGTTKCGCLFVSGDRASTAIPICENMHVLWNCPRGALPVMMSSTCVCVTEFHVFEFETSKISEEVPSPILSMLAQSRAAGSLLRDAI